MQNDRIEEYHRRRMQKAIKVESPDWERALRRIILGLGVLVGAAIGFVLGLLVASI